jgi:hypothetical protein
LSSLQKYNPSESLSTLKEACWLCRLYTSYEILTITRILELDDPTPGADANQDGGINIFDITKIARIILELD